jgi:3-oxoacyl-[acyl-carrier protein] reductase
LRLKGKVAIITGGARGIGKAIALKFAYEGASIVLVDVLEDELYRSAREIKDIGSEVLVIKADVSIVSELEKIVSNTIKLFNKIDILVNNAGIFSHSSLEELTEEQWHRVIDVNLKFALFLSKYVAIYMKKQGGGKIINIASTAGITGGYYAGIDYSISKAGIITLTKALTRRLAKYNIKVNAIAPGIIDSPMTRSWSKEVIEDLVKKYL